MKKLVIFFTALLSALPVFAQQSQTYLDIVGEADSAIAENRWEDAQRLLLRALRSEPGNPTNVLLMSNLGIVRFQLGQDSLALATLNEAHAIAPASVTVLSNRARILNAMGRDNDAYLDYSRILELDSTVIEPRFYHGMIAMYSGDMATAEKDFAKLQELAPNATMTSIGLAALYSATGQYIEAIKQYSSLIKHDPSAAEYYSGRAACYLMTQQLNEASQDIASGLKLNPDDGELYLYRAYLNRLRYRNDDALSDARKALELGISPDRIAALLQ